MKVSTWNVNGIRARHAELVAWVAAERPDVLCLQEIKCPSSSIPEPLTTLSDYWSYWHGAGGYSGVSLHLRRAAFAFFSEYFAKTDGRLRDVTRARIVASNDAATSPRGKPRCAAHRPLPSMMIAT